MYDGALITTGSTIVLFPDENMTTASLELFDRPAPPEPIEPVIGDAQAEILVILTVFVLGLILCLAGWFAPMLFTVTAAFWLPAVSVIMAVWYWHGR